MAAEMKQLPAFLSPLLQGSQRKSAHALSFHQIVGDSEVLIERSDAEVQLFLCDDQRRRNDEVAKPGLD
jgi:hypothetical protein